MSERIVQESVKKSIITTENAYENTVNFLVPDSVNLKDKEAVSLYIDSIDHYFTRDENGNINGLNVSEFCDKATKAGLMFCDKDEKYKIVDLKSINDFTEALNLSILMIQCMLAELEMEDKIK